VENDLTSMVSAPGRFLLFGEHAIDYGHPAIALAVDFRVRCSARLCTRFMVNNEPLDPGKHPHARAAVIHGWTDMDKPISLSIESTIPHGLGLGGNAATMTACLGAISMLHDHLIFEHVAVNSFNAISEAGDASNPLDTSISTHGGAVMLDSRKSDKTLWVIKKGDRTWHVNDVHLPEMNLVLGYSGVPSLEADMSAKVRRFYERNSFARDIIKDMGELPREGFAALESNNLAKVGELMNRNHRLLLNLGVGNPALEKLILAASRHSYGAKITGAGGGGCIVALAREPEKVAKAIEGAGGKAYLLPLAKEGVRPED
jgi:mevalonate kinase